MRAGFGLDVNIGGRNATTFSRDYREVRTKAHRLRTPLCSLSSVLRRRSYSMPNLWLSRTRSDQLPRWCFTMAADEHDKPAPTMKAAARCCAINPISRGAYTLKAAPTSMLFAEKVGKRQRYSLRQRNFLIVMTTQAANEGPSPRPRARVVGVRRKPLSFLWPGMSAPGQRSYKRSPTRRPRPKKSWTLATSRLVPWL